MEGGERKEEASLPPDYVSLAQLQERWLQKQEEIKRKQKQEEDEKREGDARALKQKQEEDEKRERVAGAQNERNQNQRGGAKMGGGFVRATDVIQEKGKRKEMVRGEPGDGGKTNKKIGKNGRNFKRAAAVEEKGKVGAEDEVLSGGGARILSGEGGSGNEWSGVEEVDNVCVVEVLPREEIGHVKRSNLRGGSKKNGKYKGSPRVNKRQSELAIDLENELKQSELAIDLEKEESEMGRGKMWRGRGRGTGRGRGRERGEERGSNGGDLDRKMNILKEYGPVNEVESKLENKAKDGISEVCSEIASLRVQDRNGIRGQDSKAEVDRAEGEGTNGDKVAVEFEKKVDHRVLARKGENGGSGMGYHAIGIWGRDSKAKEDGVEGESSNGKIVAVEHEKKVDNKLLPRKGENRRFGGRYRANGIQGLDNKAKEDGVEGEGSNGDKVAMEIEKKVDHKVLPRNGDNGGFWRGYQANGKRVGGFGSRGRYTRPEISDNYKMKGRESGRVWVKKEDKLDA